MAISSAINSEFELFFGALFIGGLSLYLLVYGVSLSGITFSALIAFGVVTGMNLVSGLSFPFEGIFYNPNSLGGFYATLSFLAAGVLSEKVVKGRFLFFAFIAIIMLSASFSLISNSRAAFLSSMVAIVMLVFLYSGPIFYNGKKRGCCK